MQHLRGRIAKSDVRTTYVPRTYASSTVSRHFGAETKMSVKNIKNVWRCRDSRTAKSMKTSRDDGIKQFSIQHPTYFSHYTCIMWKDM